MRKSGVVGALTGRRRWRSVTVALAAAATGMAVLPAVAQASTTTAVQQSAAVQAAPAVPAAQVAPVASAAAAVPSIAGPAGRDYATEVFNDPWEYSNSDDMLINFSGTRRLSNQRYGGNMLSAHLDGNSAYLSPVWGGYSDSLLNGRDAALPQNGVVAARYDAFAIELYSNAPAKSNFYLAWYSCPTVNPASACSGRSGFVYLRPGWNTYVVPLGRTAGSGGSFPLDWAGTINGLRMVFNAGSSDIKLDWARLYKRDSGVRLGISGLSGRDLVWDSNGSDADNTGAASAAPLQGTAAPTWGVLPRNTPDWRAAVSGDTADLAFLPGRSWRIGTRSGPGGRVSWFRNVNLIAPLPELITPNPQGSTDYASAVLKNPWDMASGADLSSVKNMRVLSWGGGNLSGQNAGPKFNDPQLALRLGATPINTTVYHRLTITMSEDGAYNLGGGPGGGSVARVLWRTGNHNSADQMVTSKAIPVYPGVRSVTVDMAQPTGNSVISRVAWPFVSSAGVAVLRVDPNEDPATGTNGAAPRRFRIDSVQLRSDFTADGYFPVTWQDKSNLPGGSAVLRLTRTPNVCAGDPFATVRVQKGVNTTLLNTHDLANGRYYVCLTIRRGGASTNRIAAAPIVVTHSAAAARAASPTMASVTPTAARSGATAQVSWPAVGGVVGYQVHELNSDRYTVTRAATRVSAVACPNTGGRARFQVRAFGSGGVGAWSRPSAYVSC
ncbi:hypothetical protein [Nakamurella endophytica]|uniref:Fibronectin type-III domain-containing protein n=1 Tax=Nakamurella endophytica TaxID=1748367 RepID=A0A917SKQ4_9ACTN|nr:hypothetical protein [Nakamurella endophytica]GGL84695.1 hypothetical protein GCM10011594_00370 [Nakamurella endophytica]